MARCKCQKKMRLRKDGMKRCHRCGSEVMGLAMRAARGAALLAAEFPALVACTAISPVARPRRIPVVWSSEVQA